MATKIKVNVVEGTSGFAFDVLTTQQQRKNVLTFTYIIPCWRSIYYLRNKKVSERLHLYLRLESTNHKEIGEIIKALQI